MFSIEVDLQYVSYYNPDKTKTLVRAGSGIEGSRGKEWGCRRVRKINQRVLFRGSLSVTAFG